MAFIRTGTVSNFLEDRTETYYIDQNNHEYRRIAGGLAWPSGDLPGFAVVVGEDFHKDVAVGARGYRIVAENTQPNVTDLIKWAFEAQKQYKVKPWFGDTKNRGMMAFVSRFNKPYRPKGLRLRDAPQLDDPHALEYYIHLILDKTKPNRKILHFGQSQVANALMSFVPENMRGPAADKYPGITSLGYAVSYLDSFDPASRYEIDRCREEMIRKRTVPGI